MGIDDLDTAERIPMSRRTLLKLAGATGVALAAGPALDLAQRVTASAGTAVTPTPNALWTITSPVVLDSDATVAGVVIEPGGEPAFDPSREVTLTSTRNVIVRGKLSMRPATPDVAHRLVFSGISESAFVGGGMDPLDSDVGLWVMDTASWTSRAAPGPPGRGRSVALRGARRPSRWTRTSSDGGPATS